MAGCFGNHPVDRWIESQLYRYLDECDEYADSLEDCPDCNGTGCAECNYTGNIERVKPEYKQED